MLSVAASRNKINETITVACPQDGIEFEIAENDLLSRNIKLGDFCRLEVKKNVLESYELDVVGIPCLKVEVIQDSVEITGVTGIFIEKHAMYFKTEKFGDVACLEEDPGNVGESFRITISRLQPKDRVGMYSRYVWGAVKQKIRETPPKNSEAQLPESFRPQYTENTARPSTSSSGAPPQRRPLFETRPNKVTNTSRRSDSDCEHDILKRAVITTIMPNKTKKKKGTDSIAFVWLLEDHLPAIFRFSKGSYTLCLGQFFEGLFVLNKSGWMCTQYNRQLGELMDGIVTSNNNIEFHITVHDHLPLNPSENRIAAETSHRFLGRIIDQFECLPADCSSGVKIAIRLMRVTSRQEWCWVVHRVLKSKHAQTLSEFYDVWRIPGMRALIRVVCYHQYESLRYLLDTSEVDSMRNTLANGNDNVGSVENEEETPNELESEGDDFIFGWTTSVNDDVVEMIVFPRIHGQRMETMKKTVTDQSVFTNVGKVTSGTLYRLEMNDRKEVAEVWDCPQYISLNEAGLFEFKFVSSGELLLARNVAVVEPIGVPKAFGKLMFHLPNLPISKTKKVSAKAHFRLLEDDDAFMGHDLVVENNVCFLSVGNIEKPENHTLKKAPGARPDEEPVEPTVFIARLQRMDRNAVFSLFRDVCTILSNDEVLDLLETNGLDTQNLFDLIKKTNHN